MLNYFPVAFVYRTSEWSAKFFGSGIHWRFGGVWLVLERDDGNAQDGSLRASLAIGKISGSLGINRIITILLLCCESSRRLVI